MEQKNNHGAVELIGRASEVSEFSSTGEGAGTRATSLPPLTEEVQVMDDVRALRPGHGEEGPSDASCRGLVINAAPLWEKSGIEEAGPKPSPARHLPPCVPPNTPRHMGPY